MVKEWYNTRKQFALLKERIPDLITSAYNYPEGIKPFYDEKGDDTDVRTNNMLKKIIPLFETEFKNVSFGKIDHYLLKALYEHVKHDGDDINILWEVMKNGQPLDEMGMYASLNAKKYSGRQRNYAHYQNIDLSNLKSAIRYYENFKLRVSYYAELITSTIEWMYVSKCTVKTSNLTTATSKKKGYSEIYVENTTSGNPDKHYMSFGLPMTLAENRDRHMDSIEEFRNHVLTLKNSNLTFKQWRTNRWKFIKKLKHIINIALGKHLKQANDSLETYHVRKNKIARKEIDNRIQKATVFLVTSIYKNYTEHDFFPRNDQQWDASLDIFGVMGYVDERDDFTREDAINIGKLYMDNIQKGINLIKEHGNFEDVANPEKLLKLITGSKVGTCDVCKRDVTDIDDKITCPMGCLGIFHAKHFFESVRIKPQCPTCREPVSQVQVDKLAKA